MSPDEQGLGVVDGPRSLGLRAVPTNEGAAKAPESKVIRDLLRQRRALPRDLSGAAPLQKAMARDLLGFDTLPPSAITYHAMLSSIGRQGGLNLVDSTWPAGTHIERHLHHTEDELLVVLSGLVEIRIAGRTFRCEPGETAFIARGLEHEVRAVTETRHICILTRKSLQGPQPI